VLKEAGHAVQIMINVCEGAALTHAVPPELHFAASGIRWPDLNSKGRGHICCGWSGGESRRCSGLCVWDDIWMSGDLPSSCADAGRHDGWWVRLPNVQSCAVARMLV